MSNGRFARTKYQADDGTIHFCRAQPESMTTSPANAAPAGSINAKGQAKVSGSRRTLGLHTRGVVIGIEYPVNAPGQDLVYTKKTFIPILTPETYNSGAFQEGQSITYLSETWVVIDQVPEVWN